MSIRAEMVRRCASVRPKWCEHSMLQQRNIKLPALLWPLLAAQPCSGQLPPFVGAPANHPGNDWKINK